MGLINLKAIANTVRSLGLVTDELFRILRNTHHIYLLYYILFRSDALRTKYITLNDYRIKCKETHRCRVTMAQEYQNSL